MRGATITNKSGTMAVIQHPSTHGLVQKTFERPLPTEHRIEALKNVVVVVSSWIGNATHERDGSIQLS
jgi:hypothetical protein